MDRRIARLAGRVLRGVALDLLDEAKRDNDKNMEAVGEIVRAIALSLLEYGQGSAPFPVAALVGKLTALLVSLGVQG